MPGEIHKKQRIQSYIAIFINDGNLNDEEWWIKYISENYATTIRLFKKCSHCWKKVKMVDNKLILSHINNNMNNITIAQQVDDYGDLKFESLVTKNTRRNKCHNS